MPDDAFIAGRIRWRASKHGLPDHDTYEFADAPDAVRSSFDDICRDHDIGLAVLVFGNAPERWTVIGTRAVISHYDGAVHHCELSQIADFDSGMPRVPKKEMEYLNVTLNDSSLVRLWGPRGSQFFALWSILLSLSRMDLAADST